MLWSIISIDSTIWHDIDFDMIVNQLIEIKCIDQSIFLIVSKWVSWFWFLLTNHDTIEVWFDSLMIKIIIITICDYLMRLKNQSSSLNTIKQSIICSTICFNHRVSIDIEVSIDYACEWETILYSLSVLNLWYKNWLLSCKHITHRDFCLHGNCRLISMYC